MKLNALPMDCPFCHCVPELVRAPLWHGNHGYYGNYEYFVACTNKDCHIKPSTMKYTDIYEMDEDDCFKKAIDDWNTR